MQKSTDECGLVAEVLKHVPDFFIDALVVQCNGLMRTGQVPTDWRKTSFKMLPKTMCAKVPSEYRPLATIRLSFFQLGPISANINGLNAGWMQSMEI